MRDRGNRGRGSQRRRAAAHVGDGDRDAVAALLGVGVGPETTKAVPTPPGWLTVPTDTALPSPQLTLAVKSETGAIGLASVKVPTVPENPAPSVAVTPTGLPAVRGASATVAVEVSVAALPSELETSTLVV